jgi:IclR family pca regulon transcriptional regulator
VTSVEVLLDELRVVARQGYAASNEEWEPGLCSIAAPVHARDGRVVAAVCVIVVRPAVTTHRLRLDFLPALLETTQAISTELGYRGCPTGVAGAAATE